MSNAVIHTMSLNDLMTPRNGSYVLENAWWIVGRGDKKQKHVFFIVGKNMCYPVCSLKKESCQIHIDNRPHFKGAEIIHFPLAYVPDYILREGKIEQWPHVPDSVF